jgi:hypothetical protein
MVQAAEHLLCKYEALNSNPSPTEKEICEKWESEKGGSGV